MDGRLAVRGMVVIEEGEGSSIQCLLCMLCLRSLLIQRVDVGGILYMEEYLGQESRARRKKINDLDAHLTF